MTPAQAAEADFEEADKAARELDALDRRSPDWWPRVGNLARAYLALQRQKEAAEQQALVEYKDHQQTRHQYDLLKAQKEAAERERAEARLEADGLRSIVVEWRGKYDEAEIRARQAIAERDLASWGIIEIAARNVNVKSYMEHWEGRTEEAEAALTASRAQARALRKALRSHAIEYRENGKAICRACNRSWRGLEEDHAPGCLAAPSKEGE